MQIPISKRLLGCASLITPGGYVADIGTDHGYLAIWLLKNHLAQHVYASDLRELPIKKAEENAALFGIKEHISFYCASGLDAIPHDRLDTVVCAGMGADTICSILQDAPWLPSGCELVLQPQSSGQDLRRMLCETGYEIDRELLISDGGFLYTALHAVRTGKNVILTPGEQFLSPALRREASPLLGQYLERLLRSMEKTLAGMEKGNPAPERIGYYKQAFTELEDYRRNYDNSK